MTNGDLIREVDCLCDELSEARRWCRTQPKAAVNHVDRFRNRLQDIRSHDAEIDGIAYRLAMNLHVGAMHHLCSPGVLEGYVSGAAFELSIVRARLVNATRDGRATS